MVISFTVGVGLVAAGTDPKGAIVYAAAVLGVTLTFATARTVRRTADADPPSRGRVSAWLSSASVSHGSDACRRRRAVGAAGRTTPFGLAARAAPYADNRVVPLLVLAVFPIRSQWLGCWRRGIAMQAAAWSP